MKLLMIVEAAQENVLYPVDMATETRDLSKLGDVIGYNRLT